MTMSSEEKNKIPILTATDLLDLQLPKLHWFVENIIPLGLLILAARPKFGKSYLSLNLAISISTGRKFLEKYETNKSKVLYISNEDSLRRLQTRISSIISQIDFDEHTELNNLILNTDFPKLDSHGLDYLRKLVKQENIKLVIVDTFFKQIVFTKTRGNNYLSEYETTGRLQTFAIENNVGILLVHHTRKGESDNPIDAILGTSGISGSADTILIIDKKSGKNILELIGKDVEPLSIAMSFKNGVWRFKEPYTEMSITPEREEILELLKSEKREMRTSEIAEALGKKSNNISTMLKKMVADEKIKNPKFGIFSVE